MPKLFTDTGHYTDDANKLDDQITNALSGFLRNADNPREMLTLIILAATLECSTVMLQRGVEVMRAKRHLQANMPPEA
jgi:hypothetical protein